MEPTNRRFDSARDDNIQGLLAAARKHGMAIANRPSSKGNRIWIVHRAYRKGLPRRFVRQPFATFAEALRSLDYTLVSICASVLDTNDLAVGLQKLDDLLRSSKSYGQKFRGGESRVVGILSNLKGVRVPNLVNFRERLELNYDGAKKGLLELIEDGNWPGACCSIVLALKRQLSAEACRRLDQIPNVRTRRIILQRIWNYEIWHASYFETQLRTLTQRAELCQKHEVTGQQLLEDCEAFLVQHQEPSLWSWRLSMAFDAVGAIRDRVLKGQFGKRAAPIWRRALTHATSEVRWLHQVDRLDSRQGHLFAA